MFNIFTRLFRVGLWKGASAFAGYLTQSPTFHRFVHTTNRTIFSLIKRVSEKPEVAEQTERLKQTMQNQSAFVKDKAKAASSGLCSPISRFLLTIQKRKKRHPKRIPFQRTGLGIPQDKRQIGLRERFRPTGINGGFGGDPGLKKRTKNES
jgi:hypothetical protein